MPYFHQSMPPSRRRALTAVGLLTVAALAGAGVRVFGVEKQSSTLEELFLEVTGGETV